MKALTHKLLREVWRMRGQLASIALIVAAGVMSAVSMRSTFVSLERARDAYFRDFRFADVFASLQRAPDAVLRDVEKIPGVMLAEPRVKHAVTLAVAGLEQPARGVIVSVPSHGVALLNYLQVTLGRTIDSERANEVLVSQRFAELNRIMPGDTLRAVLNGRLHELIVVGRALSPEYVYEVEPSAAFLSDERLFGVIWMSRDAIAAAIDMAGAFNDLSLRLAPNANEAAVISALDDVLRPYGGLGAYGRVDQVSTRIVNDEIRQNRATANILPIVFLCVAAFLLHIVLNRLIGTQRVNIATLKAFGYQHRRIAIHYLLFALIATVTGVVLGLLTGRWMGSAYTGMYAEIFRFPSLPFTIDWVSFAVAAGISILAGLLGAAGALRAVVRLEAAEGMNPAPPARYRPLILERWRLQHLLSPVQRMVMRNVERRPARAFLASVGVGAGLAVLLVGLNILDAVVEMVNLQFANMQREDVTVVFRTEQPRRAYREVARIESVQHVEPFWSVPVRFTHNQHTRRIAITGITEDSKLRRLLDRQGGRHPLPLAGIVMTDRLASVLQLAVGDTVSVARLDRSGVDWQSTISGHTDEIAGLNAYLVDTDMQRVLREDRRVSGAYLKVERGKELNVVRRLQDIPDVIGVYSKATALRAFEKQLAESLRITFTILFILGGVLASGVVYNTTRIALSERSHELATLRVLGFSGREIGNMLLGEQAVIVAAALPLGAALGAFVSMIIIRAFETEYYRVPFVMTWHSVLLASLAIVAVAALSGAVVKRKLMRLDLIAALKVRE